MRTPSPSVAISALSSWRGCVAVALFATACASSPGALFYRDADPTVEGSHASASNRFGFELYSVLRREKGNIVWSPLSTWLALAMALEGAQGRTATELAEALHLPDQGAASGEPTALVHALQDSRGESLALANRIFADLALTLHPAFTQATANAYGAEVARVDFLNHTEASRKRINTWVQEQTRGHIRDLIPSGGIRPKAQLVLTNCVYFAAHWAKKFDPSDTEPADFEAPTGTVEVPTMHRNAVMAYAEVDGAKLLELNYEHQFAMDVLLPDEPDGLPALESGLSLADVQRFLGRLRLYEVEAAIPRFRLRFTGEMSSPLSALGVVRAFAPEANFGAISAQSIRIDSIYHQAYIDVDEKGTEAAAATAITLMAVSQTTLPDYPSASFIADHPFLFMIRDLKTGAILFMGRVADPRG
jgi:serpin B